ncbi:DUF2478 domain-containing protein [Primorskyibacter flagellatus]|uniref:DUF2478 domain-containing protein n=1 Tax=Primorskyibacter flagellatus TaxID=1387277 RepID=A0A1W2AKM7_9RHOB|nr:Protein of unknown function [Primorskyibacter flagellatus]
MLGYVVADGRGAADRLIRDVAARLRDNGLRLTGAVQVNPEGKPAHKCHMDLHILSGTEVVRISQDLGTHSQGCRLDPDGLERAVGLVTAGLDDGADLLVVNKFGKQEMDGRGFRPVIAEALSRDIPVLVAVNPGSLDAFLTYAEDLAEPLEPDVTTVAAWCLRQRAPDHV